LVIARKLGHEPQTQFSYEVAEKGFQHAMEAGEFYTLGSVFTRVAVGFPDFRAIGITPKERHDRTNEKGKEF
jgi:hypothetical protein